MMQEGKLRLKRLAHVIEEISDSLGFCDPASVSSVSNGSNIPFS